MVCLIRGDGEDDDKVGSTLRVDALGSGSLVAALDDALVGMRVGGRRRVQVKPERGWKLAPGMCAAQTGVMRYDPVFLRASHE